MDNSSDTCDSVAPGSGHLVHVGWLRPHFARLGDHRCIDPRDPRAQTGLKFRAGKFRARSMADTQFTVTGRTMRTHWYSAGAHLFDLLNFLAVTLRPRSAL